MASGAWAEEVAGAEETGVAEVAENLPTPEYQLLWTGPRSLDSLIDERRDVLRDRRRARSDAFRHLHGLFDPVMEYERDLHRAYSDRMRDLYRVQRDAMQFHRDAYLAAFMPWAKMHKDRVDARRHGFALESLERQEMMDDLRFAYEPLFGPPFPW
jgi:hypothetical protein